MPPSQRPTPLCCLSVADALRVCGSGLPASRRIADYALGMAGHHRSLLSMPETYEPEAFRARVFDELRACLVRSPVVHGHRPPRQSTPHRHLRCAYEHHLRALRVPSQANVGGYVSSASPSTTPLFGYWRLRETRPTSP